MMIPFPYDWVAGWKAKYKIELSKEAEDELIKLLESI